MAILGRLQPTNIYRPVKGVWDLPNLTDPPGLPAGFWRTSIDNYLAYLIQLGYITGTVADREYARLIAKTGVTPAGHTLYDLYYLAGERPFL